MGPLLQKVNQALAWHNERHKPTGFDFALADSVDYLDGAAWDSLTDRTSFFLKRPYLRALEKARPTNLQVRYGLLFKGKQPLAALALQSVRVTADRVMKAGSSPLGKLKVKVLVCGNLLSWGQHGVAFAPDVDPAKVWPGVSEALYRLRRAERLDGSTELVLVKDIPQDGPPGVEALKRFSYGPVETDPDMVLTIQPSWNTFDDYLVSLHSKYRKNAVRVSKDLEAGGCRIEPLVDVGGEAQRLHALYLQVHEGAAVRPVTISPNYIAALAELAGADFRCVVARRGGEIVGFVTTLKDGETAVGYYIGFDRKTNDEIPVYFGLLQAVVADAIAMGCRRLSLGRTALEPKAKLGALPVPMKIWTRHSQPFLNIFVRSLLGVVPHHEAPERNPFKD